MAATARALLLVGVVVAVALGVGAYRLATSSSGDPGPSPPRSRTTKTSKSHRSVRLVERPTGTLPAPLQDAALVALDGRPTLLLGGLRAADTSTDSILVAGERGARQEGALPTALHDSAAVRLGRSVYLFGGGTGSRQLDTIVRVDPRSGTTAAAGRLPAPSSDQAAAAVAGTAYVVGGFTGGRWLDTIVAWRPGTPARVVAHLPSPVRYAAVAAVGNRLVIAGGSLPNGNAGEAILEYDPAARRIVRIGRLPAPTTHAAAAARGDFAYVIGGRGAAVGSATARIVAVDLASRRIKSAGRLSTPRSDLAAVTMGNRILLAGGHGNSGTEAILSELVPKGSHPRALAVTHVTNVYAYDRANMLAPAARTALQRIYVPNSESATVDVIDPHTYKVVAHFAVGALPQHVTQAYDLKTLYVTNDLGNSLTPINPSTGKPGAPIPVDDPYNMYFTANGRFAIVVAERLHRLDFRDAHTFRLHHSLTVPCVGVDHRGVQKLSRVSGSGWPSVRLARQIVCR